LIFSTYDGGVLELPYSKVSPFNFVNNIVELQAIDGTRKFSLLDYINFQIENYIFKFDNSRNKFSEINSFIGKEGVIETEFDFIRGSNGDPVPFVLTAIIHSSLDGFEKYGFVILNFYASNIDGSELVLSGRDDDGNIFILPDESGNYIRLNI